MGYKVKRMEEENEDEGEMEIGWEKERKENRGETGRQREGKKEWMDEGRVGGDGGSKQEGGRR